jgi:MFS transporter, DHA2 family, methylenomycin A resistance protein
MKRGYTTAVVLSCAANFMLVLDATAVNVALPSLRHDLGGSIADLQWVVDAYTLAFGALLLLTGSLSDRIGAKDCFGIGTALFAAGSAGCGFAGSVTVLIVARVIQGFGAAMMLPASLALVAHEGIEPHVRARAVSLWAAAGGGAVAAGPVIGGLLTQGAGWRSVFFINVPLAVLALIVTPRIGSSPRHRVRFDFAGNLLAAATLAALTFALIEGGEVGFGEPQIIGASVAFVAFALAFVAVERRVQSPALPLHLLGTRAAISTIFGGMTIYFGFYGLVFTLSLLMQESFKYGPVRTGLMFLPMSVVVVVSTLQAARWARRHASWVPLSVGTGAMALALVMLVCVKTSAQGWLLILGTCIFGGASGIASPAVLLNLIPLVPASQSGVASAVVSTMRQAGATIGVAVFGTLLVSGSNLDSGAPTAMIVGAGTMALGAIAILTGLRRAGAKPAGGGSGSGSVSGSGGAEPQPVAQA